MVVNDSCVVSFIKKAEHRVSQRMHRVTQRIRISLNVFPAKAGIHRRGQARFPQPAPAKAWGGYDRVTQRNRNSLNDRWKGHV